MNPPRPPAGPPFVLTVLLSTAVVACGGAQTPRTVAPRAERRAAEFFPLRQGAAWSFESTDIDRGGVPGLIVMRVVRDDRAGGFYVEQGRGAPAVYESTGEGLVRNGELVLANPIREGTRWRGRGGDSYVIRSVGTTRTVPAGTFRDVIEVVRIAGEATLTNGTEYRETYYYAPGVGPVEAEVPVMLAPGDVRRFKLVLRGYTLDGDL